MSKDSGLLGLIKKAIELAMPDMRHFYRMTRKAKVVAVYASDGKYYADVQPLLNNESEDVAEPVVPKVEIPVIWGGPQRGVVCPPTVGVHCDLSYYDGDPNYPHISNFRWHSMKAPVAALNEFVIQLEPGVELRIDKEKQIVSLTPASWIVHVGENAEIVAKGNVSITAHGDHASLTGAKEVTITAPVINQNGNVRTRGQKEGNRGHIEENCDRIQNGWLNISGNVTIGGNLTVQGNSHAGSRSGGTCPHTSS